MGSRARCLSYLLVGGLVARKAPATKRTTLYRMVEGCGLDTSLAEAYREHLDYDVQDIVIESWHGRLVHGSVRSAAKWAADVAQLTGTKVKLANQSSGAVLLLRDPDETVWALTWGTGFHFLETEQIDFGFGARIVARCADAREVKSLTKTILDHRARVDRSSLPRGSTVRDLGVDGYGEVVSRIEATAELPGLTAGDKPILIRASDSLNLPLAKTSQPLIRDINALRGVAKQPVIRGLESLEQLVALKPKDPHATRLDGRLHAALENGDTARIGMSWPHERLDTFGPATSCHVWGFADRGGSRIFDQVPDIDDVVSWFADTPTGKVHRRLRNIRLQLHGEADPTSTTAVSLDVPLIRWLTAEFREGPRRFCLHDGNWYRMDDRYLERIDNRVAEILDEPASLDLPPWPAEEHEDSYDQRTSELHGGVLIDRKLIRTPLHSRGGIEPCDVFVPPGVLIHVKRGRRSADLSHLLAQALVAADTLARDEYGRRAWTKRVLEESRGRVTDARITEVILGIGQPKPVTVDSLFTFTKVNLVRLHDALRYIDVNVRVVGIPEC